MFTPIEQDTARFLIAIAFVVLVAAPAIGLLVLLCLRPLRKRFAITPPVPSIAPDGLFPAKGAPTASPADSIPQHDIEAAVQRLLASHAATRARKEDQWT